MAGFWREYCLCLRIVVTWLWFPRRSWLWWLVAAPLWPYTAHYVVYYQIRYGEHWAVFGLHHKM